MSLHEPATFLTDLLLVALAAWLAWRLQRATAVDNRAARWFGRALALTAASAFIGGTYHGFAPNLPASVEAAWWRSTLLTIDLLSAAMALSWMHEIVPPRWHRWLRGAIAVKFIAFVAVALRQPVFAVAIVDYGSTLLAWLIVAAVLRRAWRSWMLTGLAFSALAAAVQQLHWAPAAWFNHNDLYHLIQACSLVALKRAACLFGPPNTAPSP